MVSKRFFQFVILILATSLYSSAQDISLQLQKVPQLSNQALQAQWKKVSRNVTVGYVSTGQRFARELFPSEKLNSEYVSYAWKNERVYAQVLVSSKISINNLRVIVSDLKNETGLVLPKEQISVGFLDYVLTDEFRDGCGHRKSTDFDSSWVADIINTKVSSKTVSKNNTQPVWVTINIPAKQAAGIYNGQIIVKADKEYSLPLTIVVGENILPAPRDWSFQLDYWQHPAAIARVHDLKLWSDEHFNSMRSYYSMLANAGQKIITASIVNEPWGHQTFDDFPSLIKWTRKKDGTWSFDYGLFDKYIHFVMSCGITERINCYSMVPWKIAFQYFDETLQRDTVFTEAIGTAAYNAFWKTMLTDFTAHLKKKGWFNITTIAMDERPMQAMQSVISLLKSIDPNWKISLAGDWHPEIAEDIYDYCVASRFKLDDELLQNRKQAGKITTWYVCCTEKYPNMFTFSPPAESVWAGWYTAASGFEGFLRWAYNSWTKSPLTDTRFVTWPAGDTYQVYPGPLSSVRFEKLIEGIQDYEKIIQLRKLYKANNESTKLLELETALKNFEIENLSKQSAQEMLDKYKHLLR